MIETKLNKIAKKNAREIAATKIGKCSEKHIKEVIHKTNANTYCTKVNKWQMAPRKYNVK